MSKGDLRGYVHNILCNDDELQEVDVDVLEILTHGNFVATADTLNHAYVHLSRVALGDSSVAVVYKYAKHEGRRGHPGFSWEREDQTNPYLEDFALYLAKLTELATLPSGALREAPGTSTPVWVQEFVQGKLGFEWKPEFYSADLCQQHHDLLVFDVVIGNEDRHGGNWFYTLQEQVVGIDHGLCFRLSKHVRPYIGATQFFQVARHLGCPNNESVYQRADRLPLTEAQQEKVARILNAEAEVRGYGASIGATTPILDSLFYRAERLQRKGYLPNSPDAETEFLA